MRDYQVHFKDGTTKEIEVGGRKELIDLLFNGSEQKLKDKVSMLTWGSVNMSFSENVQSGKVESTITTADVNPYGWRSESMSNN